MSTPYLAPVRVNPVCVHPQERRVALHDGWGFRLDPEDRGVRERWFADAGLMTEPIAVPGCWQGQGFGGDSEETVWDFNLSARTLRATYQGTGWYAKRFQMPEGWAGQRAWLNFGGVHPSAEVWLNGVRLGEHHAPFVSFGFEITELLAEENQLVVRVSEQARELGFAFSWQGSWSGLYRDVELSTTGACAIRQFAVTPDVERETLTLGVSIDGFQPGRPLTLRVTARPLTADGEAITAELPITEAAGTFVVRVPSPNLWSPDNPHLYRIDAVLLDSEQALDALSERVGFVDLATREKHFLVNGEPYYMRGTGDFISNPETGCPDTDRARWRTKLQTLRDYGYNYVRCQSFVPAPEYLDVADEVGLLVQSEMGMLGGWGGSSAWHIYAWPQPTPAHREAIRRQWEQVVVRDVNHPSANIYCMSNELSDSLFPRLAWQCYHNTKALKPTAMVIWTDGGYHENLPGDFVNAEASQDAQCAKPLIQHEFRWWSSFPDVRSMHKYAGAVRPYAAEMALDAAARHGISHVLADAAATSQRLQFLEAKGKMESCRRENPRLAGICHFNAMDANPSPQGIVDEFYQRKYADSALWQQTNGDAVLLADLAFDDRVLCTGDTFRCSLAVSDFTHPPFQHPAIRWRLLAGQQVLAEGTIAYAHEPFCTCPAGSLEVSIPAVAQPTTARLEAVLTEDGREISNQWDLWLFPAQAALPAGVACYGQPQHTWLTTMTGMPQASADELGQYRAVLTERLDEAVLAYARRGGRVILAASEGLLRPFNPKFGFALGHYFFTPPANYPPYEDGHDGTIIRRHPLLGALPHEGFADLQFFRLITNAPPLDLEPLGLTDGEPVIRVMHSFPVGRPLGYLVDGALGHGALIVCALKLDQTWPEARFLLVQMCQYAVGDALQPSLTLTADAVARLVAGVSLP